VSAGKGIAGHNGKPAPLAIPGISRRVEFLEANIDVGKLPEGARMLSIIDPGSKTLYTITLPADAARQIGQALISSVQVAGVDEMPKAGPG
jgi:hypothetical protein